MNIALDIKQFAQPEEPGFGGYLQELFQLLVLQNPDYRLLILADKGSPDLFPAGEHNKTLLSRSIRTNRLLQRYWFSVQLPSILKKSKTDLYISVNGAGMKDSKWPQCMILPRSEWVTGKVHNGRDHLEKINKLIVFSAETRQILAREHSLADGKIEVLEAAAPSLFQPVDRAVKQAYKERFTAGKEFFICTGPIGSGQNLVTLLKAFSVFKKKQHSGLKLVLAGNPDKTGNKFRDELAAYKYRDDVIITGKLPPVEKAGLLAAAYVLVDPSLRPGTGLAVREAMACQVPVIAAPGQPVPGNETYLETDTRDHEDMAERMIRLYKDETLRSRLIQQALQSTAQNNMQRSAACLAKVLSGILH